MDSLDKLFQARYSEITELVDRLSEDENSPLSTNPTITTLKATLFLLYYNLIESIVYTVFETIFDEIYTNCQDFSLLSPNIQRQYQKYNKESNVPDAELLQLSLKQYSGRVTLFSGNLDARSIRKLFHDWGIVSDFHTIGEEKLLDIKSYRNALAHGERAFKEVGRNYTMQDMKEYNQVLYTYLSGLLLNVRHFLDNKQYLAT